MIEPKVTRSAQAPGIDRRQDVVEPADLGGEGAPERLLVERAEPARRVGAGAVEDGGHRAELGLRGPHRRAHGSGVGDVRRDVAQGEPRRRHAFQVGGQLGVGLGPRAPEERQPGAARGSEVERALGRDPLAAAGDEQDVVRPERQGGFSGGFRERAPDRRPPDAGVVVHGFLMAFLRGASLRRHPGRGLGVAERHVHDPRRHPGISRWSVRAKPPPPPPCWTTTKRAVRPASITACAASRNRGAWLSSKTRGRQRSTPAPVRREASSAARGWSGGATIRQLPAPAAPGRALGRERSTQLHREGPYPGVDPRRRPGGSRCTGSWRPAAS